MTRTAILIRVGVTVVAVVAAGLVLLTSSAANRRAPATRGDRGRRAECDA